MSGSPFPLTALLSSLGTGPDLRTELASIRAAPYRLTAAEPWAGALGEPRAGAVLAVEWADGAVGYADLHPWPSLGDPTLEALLGWLAAPDLHPLLSAALAASRADALARGRGQRWCADRPIPESHRLIPALEHPPAAVERARAAARCGFRALKLKIGGPAEAEAEALRAIAQAVPGLALRLDANGRLSADELAVRHASWGDRVCAQIQWIEDPTDPGAPEAAELWPALARALRVALAWDRGSEALARGEPLPGAEIVVLKPARTCDPAGFVRAAKRAELAVAVTCNLGHPIEQVLAAAVACELREELRWAGAGLFGHELHEPLPGFSLASSGPHLLAPDGPGVGFGEALADLGYVPVPIRG